MLLFQVLCGCCFCFRVVGRFSTIWPLRTDTHNEHRSKVITEVSSSAAQHSTHTHPSHADRTKRPTKIQVRKCALEIYIIVFTACAWHTMRNIACCVFGVYLGTYRLHGWMYGALYTCWKLMWCEILFKVFLFLVCGYLFAVCSWTAKNVVLRTNCMCLKLAVWFWVRRIHISYCHIILKIFKKFSIRVYSIIWLPAILFVASHLI